MSRTSPYVHRITLVAVAIAAFASPPWANAQVVIGLDEMTLELDLGGSGDPAFHSVTGVALSKGGELYVADHFKHSVRVFDLEGRLLREFGGPGEAPGEFNSLGVLQLSDSIVRIVDSGLSRVSTFSTGGSLLSTAPSREERNTGGRSPTAVSTLQAGWNLALSFPVLRGMDLEADDANMYVIALDGAGGGDTLLAQPLSTEIYYPRDRPNWVTAGLGGLFGTSALWDVSGDSLVAVLDTYDGSGRLFRIMEDGPREAGAFDLGWSPLPVDQPREVRAAQGRASEERGGSPDDWEVAVPEYYAQSGGLHIADGGRLWIHHDPELGGGAASERKVWYRRDEPQRWYVLSWRSGQLLATVETPGNFRVHGVKGEQLFGVHYDELDVQTVRVYRIPAIPESLSGGF